MLFHSATTLSAIIGYLILFLWILISIISFQEGEKRAGTRSLLFSFLMPLPFLLSGYGLLPASEIISLLLSGLSIIFLLIIFLPINGKKPVLSRNSSFRQDERDVVFSRDELIPDTDTFKEYYNKNPEKLKTDDQNRSRQGLLSDDSIYYEPLLYSAARANFNIIEQFRAFCGESKAGDKANLPKDELTAFIKKWAKKTGADDCGICQLKPSHLYSHRGRAPYYGQKINTPHPHSFAVVLLSEMDKSMFDYAPAAPAIMESSEKYLKTAVMALQMAELLKLLGYESRAHIDGNYELICPLVAQDAGLGTIGRMGLLMSPSFGPRCRISVVTTNADLLVDTRKADQSIIDFCSICKKCANNCPGNAIPKDRRKINEGSLRWKLNSEKCFSYWCVAGTDCGRCISVCPYSHPDNSFHNIIRFFLKRSYIFRRFALFMDDALYGKKPPVKGLPWK